MANLYQQQVFQRKLTYLGLVVALLVATWCFRNYVVEPRARGAGLLEESHGDVEVIASATNTTLSGLRGWVICYKWMQAGKQQRKNQWNELDLTVRQVTRLQPHLI